MAYLDILAAVDKDIVYKKREFVEIYTYGITFRSSFQQAIQICAGGVDSPVLKSLPSPGSSPKSSEPVTESI